MNRLFEVINDGFEVMVLGLGTVFIALFALIFVVELINKLVNPKKKSINKSSVTDTLIKMEEQRLEQAEQLVDDPGELVAVITAAIAASLNRSTHSVIVTSIKKIPNSAPAWNQAGRQEQIATRLH